ITPSRQNLKIMKEKTIAAKKGHELLKKKCDALKTKLRVVMTNLIENKKQMGEDMADALLLYAKAQYGADDFSQNVFDAVKKPSIRVAQSVENVAGVKLP
ncbi:V-type proton ATPase subunit D-like, partial [Palaemon carinicauda]|uniref:V-type proton ATPase subunit D-like n=1 Tax=Palaemon carinicauda TaxID=392227 RepID=UPI0035B649E0